MRKSMSKIDAAQYRPCAGLMIVNRQGQAFVGKRIDTKDSGWWQMPQGGIDDGEDVLAAALRELAEETGLSPDKVSILAQSSEELFYDLPPELVGTLWGGRYLGQRQIWFLLRFEGEDSDIALDAHDPPEFCEWRWIDPQQLPELIIPFKVDIYRAVLAEFLPLL
jgi:putative (di)nucleoside polyphosphate hydrolase